MVTRKPKKSEPLAPTETIAQPAPAEPTDAELQAEVAQLVTGCAGCGTKIEPPTVQKPCFDLFPVVALLLQHGDFTQDEKDKIILAGAALADYRLKTRLVNGQWPVYLVPVDAEITDHSPFIGHL